MNPFKPGPAGLQLKKPVSGMKLSKPKQLLKPAAGSVFGDMGDSLDDDASERARVSAELRMGGGGASHSQRAAAAAHAAALEADASIFDYDAGYDEMQAKRAGARQATAPQAKERGSAKYIDSIMKAHKDREFENEKVFERKLVKEAEAEAHLYGEKERFLTSAYRKKIEARNEYEAELKRREAEDAKNDVTKRGGLTHFYANLLDDNLAGNTGDVAAAATSTAVATSTAAASAGSGSSSVDVGGGGSADAAADTASADDGRAAAAPRQPAPLVDESLASSISDAVSAMKRKEPAAAEAAAPAAPVYDMARRNDGDAVMSAKERFLARKRQKASGGGGDE